MQKAGRITVLTACATISFWHCHFDTAAAYAAAPAKPAKPGVQASKWEELFKQGKDAQAKNDLPAAEKALKEAWLETQKFSRSDVRIFQTLNAQLTLAYAQRNMQEADKIFRKLVAFTEDAKGVDHADVGESLKNYEALVQSMGDAHKHDLIENRKQALRKGADGQHSHIANLIGPEITDDDAAFLLHGLEEDVWQLDGDNAAITDRTMALLGPFNNLERVQLSGTKITDNGLKYLGNKDKLRMLMLSNTAITDAGLTNLHGLDALLTLTLSDTSIKGIGFSSLKALPRLKTIYLEKMQLSDEGYLALAQLPAVEELELSHSNVSDAQIARLASMPNLKRLNLFDTQVSDQAIPSLKKLKLVSVNLNRTNVTKAGVKALQEALPQARIGFGE